MTSIRKQISAKIGTDNPGLDAYPFGIAPKELRRPAVAVFRETVSQDPASLDHGFVIQIFSTYSFTSEEVEDALDTLLDGVLVSLRRLAVVTFKEAKRQVLADLFQGWEISASWASEDYIKANAY